VSFRSCLDRCLRHHAEPRPRNPDPRLGGKAAGRGEACPLAPACRRARGTNGLRPYLRYHRPHSLTWRERTLPGSVLSVIQALKPPAGRRINAERSTPGAPFGSAATTDTSSGRRRAAPGAPVCRTQPCPLDLDRENLTDGRGEAFADSECFALHLPGMQSDRADLPCPDGADQHDDPHAHVGECSVERGTTDGQQRRHPGLQQHTRRQARQSRDGVAEFTLVDRGGDERQADRNRGGPQAGVPPQADFLLEAQRSPPEDRQGRGQCNRYRGDGPNYLPPSLAASTNQNFATTIPTRGATAMKNRPTTDGVTNQAPPAIQISVQNAMHDGRR